LIDVAYAAEIYSKRHHLSDEAIGRALSVKVDATRKLGEILKATPKNKGVKGSAVPNRNRANLDETPTLEELGLSKKESAVAQKLADLPEEQFEQVRLGNVTIAKAIAAVDAKPKVAPIAPAPAVAPAPVIAAEDEYTREDQLIDQISELQAALVVANMNSTASEEQTQAAGYIAELQKEIKLLTAMNKQLTISRDTYQNQVAEMQRQINRQRREIDKALGTKTA
jgi:hypothetical protein